jgi:Putative phage metallopeptidase
MRTKFVPAPEVAEIANDLIPKYHPHLVDCRIEYVFINKVPKKGRKETWGTMKKITSLAAYLGADKKAQEQGVNDPFFVMTISQPVWEELGIKEKTALVDHELCHGGVETDDEGDVKLGIIPHDVEEFSCIVERYGLWRQDVKRFMKSAQKQPSEDEEKEEEEEVA